METKERAEKAVEYKKTMNCAQAVLMAYAEETGKDTDELMALGSGFGGGMGCAEATCGALCGAGIAMGLMNKSSQPTKMLMKTVLQDFKQRSGASICGDLKGLKTGEILCSCDDCVRNAVYAADAVRG